MINGKRTIKMAMAARDVKVKDLAPKLGYSSGQTLSDWLHYNKMTLAKFAEAADALGYDVALVDRSTGAILISAEDNE